MTGIFRFLATGVSLTLLIGIEAGLAQQSVPLPQATPGGSYHPGLGALMTAFVQPRHIKLGLAGSERNWPYAAYELGELSETFDAVTQLVPRHDNLAIPEMIASTVIPPMAALAAEIKGADAAAFAEGYAELTTSCNTCHRSAGHPEIVIRVPAVSSFPDQDFRAAEMTRLQVR